MWAWVILLALSAPSAWACICFSFPSAKTAWETSPLVFLGHVERTDVEFDEFGNPLPGTEWQGGDQKAWIKVDEAFKGTQADAEIRLEQPVHSCSPGVRSGQRYVFYLHPAEKSGTWIARSCHRSRSVDDAADDLLFLRALPWAANRSRLSGELEVSENSLEEGFRRVRKLSGIPVRIRGAGRLIEIVTNADGVYEVYDLPQGTYRVEFDLPKGLRLAGGNSKEAPIATSEIALSVGGGSSVNFYLREDNLVSGRLVDPKGKPLSGIEVTLEPVEGLTPSSHLPNGYTKENGTFLIESFPSGEYVLVANRSGSVSGRVPFGRVYLQGTVQREQAQILDIRDGKHVTDLVLIVPKMEPTITISGRVQFNDGQPAAEANLTLQGLGPREQPAVTSDPNGTFQVSLLSGRPVQIQAALQVFSRRLRRECPELAPYGSYGYSAQLKSAAVPVTADTDLAGLLLTLPAPSTCQAP